MRGREGGKGGKEGRNREERINSKMKHTSILAN